MPFTCSLLSDKVRCFNQSKGALYGNFIIKYYTHPKLQKEINSKTIWSPQTITFKLLDPTLEVPAHNLNWESHELLFVSQSYKP